MLVTVQLVACLFVWSNYERPANVTLWNITTRDIFVMERVGTLFQK
jgi:hypothetical protein